MSKLKVRKPFDREAVQIDFVDEDGTPHESLTQQHFKDQCDINNIIRQYDRTGLITHVAKAKAFYGDFTLVNEYQDALNLVMEAQDTFGELPAEIRAQFENDPGAFFEFVSNPQNADEMKRMGLIQTDSASVADPVKDTAETPATEGD
jgi:phage internal scaffolding protein